MAQHNDLGRRGEDIAEEYLVGQGFRIVCRDWKMGHNDADLIAWDGNTLVFIEVKTRSSNNLAQPEDWVTPDKQRTYIRLANQYVTQHRIEEEVRFDIIGIILNAQGHTLHHLRRAFDACSAQCPRSPYGLASPGRI